MATSRSTKRSSQRQPARPGQKPGQVQPPSPLGLVIAVIAALAIAAIVLFVVNSRMTASPQVAQGGTARGDGGFVKGSAQARVTLVEYSDFQ